MENQIRDMRIFGGNLEIKNDEFGINENGKVFDEITSV